MDDEPVGLINKKLWHQAIAFYILVLICVPANIYRFRVHLPFDLEPNRIVMMLILLFLLSTLLIDRSMKFHFTYIHGLMLVLLFTVFLSFTINANSLETSGEFWQTLNRFIYFGSFAINVFVISAIYANNINNIDKIFKIIAIIGLLVCMFAVIERFTAVNIFRHFHEIIPILENDKTGAVYGRRAGSIRIWGSAEHPIAFSALMTIIVPFALYSIFHTAKEHMRILYAMAVIAAIVISLLTVSRTALMGLLVQALYFMSVQKSNRNRVRIIAIMVIIFFGLYIVFPNVLGTFWTMLSPDYFQEKEINNEYGRYADYPKIMELFSQKPAFGMGYGSFNSREFFFVDNQYLRLLVEIGAVGLGALLFLYVNIIKELWKAQRTRTGVEKDLAHAMIASMLSFMVMSMFYDSFGFPQATYLFFTMIGFGVALVQHRQSPGVNTS